MYQMTLNELIDVMGESQYKDYIFETVDFGGQHNEHLINTYNDYKRQPYFINRESVGLTLTGDEVVYGDYLILDMGNHQEDMFIGSFDTIEKVEERLLSGGGYTNPFTGDMIVVIKGQRKKFSIVGMNKDNEWKTYDKDKHNFMERTFVDNYLNCKVVWED